LLAGCASFSRRGSDFFLFFCSSTFNTCFEENASLCNFLSWTIPIASTACEHLFVYTKNLSPGERERDREEEEEVDEGVRFFSSLSLFLSWNQGVSPTPFLWLSIGRSSKKHQVRKELARRHLCGVLSVAEAADSEQKKQRRRHVPRRTPTTVARSLARASRRFSFFFLCTSEMRPLRVVYCPVLSASLCSESISVIDPCRVARLALHGSDKKHRMQDAHACKKRNNGAPARAVGVRRRWRRGMRSKPFSRANDLAFRLSARNYVEMRTP
jgi:hypothetical protein